MARKVAGNRELKLVVLSFLTTGLTFYLLSSTSLTPKTYAYSSGPPPGFTGAPGEFTCAECHVPENSGTGQLVLVVPPTYIPGQTYPITVRHINNSDLTRRRWGFQLTVLDDGQVKAGNLQSQDSLTQVLDNQGPGGSRQYIEHTSLGTFVGQQGGASWTFNWTAPNTDVGRATFHVAGNQANGDGNTSEDNIYFTFAESVPVTGIPSASVQLGATSFGVGEGQGDVKITVGRVGDTSGAVSVNYASSDSAGLNNCNVFNGIASSRCDYATSVGILRFAAGETSKTISIPIVDDSYAEGNETFTVTLSNPAGVSLGTPTSATVTVSDNESTNGANPIDQTPFFVRQHYIDFLNREPDPPGFAGWQAVINNCAVGDTSCDRVHVSSAFYRSPEFQERGYFVYRFYSVSLGRKPDYAEFMPDIARVSGFLSTTELEAAKVAFIDDFMARGAFANTYNGLNNTAYVDRLLTTAGVTLPGRQGLIDSLNAGTKTRAQVLREIAESSEVNQRYFNQAFVVMQYFGYLRRDPDILYLNWIQVLDTTGDFRAMVTGFVNSLEYRFRFGP